MSDRVEVVDYDPEWPEEFAELGKALRAELTKRYFRERPGARRVHIHVRELGSFSQQVPLLLRDHLRAHPAEAAEFGEAKRRWAHEFAEDRRAYLAAKEPLVWELLRRADAWAQEIGWRPGPSDA